MREEGDGGGCRGDVTPGKTPPRQPPPSPFHRWPPAISITLFTIAQFSMPTDAPTIEDFCEPDRGRHFALPAILFVATCLSTFWLGAADWNPTGRLVLFRDVVQANWPQHSPLAALREAWVVTIHDMNWRQGLVYMGVVMGLLLAHEMGHFLMTVRYRIPASLPYFIPVPIIPFGTLGAVIGMDGSRVNRREMFDLGIAGPLAGLAVTLPIVSARHFAASRYAAAAAELLLSQPLDPPASDRLDSAELPDAGRPLPEPVQSVPDGRLGRIAGDRAEHAAGQPAGRRPCGLRPLGPAGASAARADRGSDLVHPLLGVVFLGRLPRVGGSSGRPIIRPRPTTIAGWAGCGDSWVGHRC